MSNFNYAAFVLNNFIPIAIKMIPVILFKKNSTFELCLNLLVRVEEKAATVRHHIPPVKQKVKPKIMKGKGLEFPVLINWGIKAKKKSATFGLVTFVINPEGKFSDWTCFSMDFVLRAGPAC